MSSTDCTFPSNPKNTDQIPERARPQIMTFNHFTSNVTHFYSLYSQVNL